MKARVMTVSAEDFDGDERRLAVLNSELRRIAPDIAPLLDKATIQSTKCRDVPRSYANL